MFRLPVVGLCLFLALATAAFARSESGSFSVSVGGVYAGEMGYGATIQGGRYHVKARAESSGLLGFFYAFAYSTEALGRVVSGRFVPEYYKETRERRNKTEIAEIRYRSGVPGAKTYTPDRDPGPQRIRPQDQGGTLDPMTSAFEMLRDLPDGMLCTQSFEVYDGERAGSVQLSNRRTEDDKVICDGMFRRLRGYAPKEMREQQAFPFRIFYAPIGDGLYRVIRLDAPSTAGRVIMTRR